MKILLLTPIAFLTVLFVSAQDSWRIKLNNKTVLLSSREDEQANTKKIKAAAWRKNGYLQVVYKDPDAAEDSYRTLIISDEADNELVRQDSVNSLKIPIRTLKKALGGNRKIQIFTTVLPSDPELAARVRVRRVHLCTLELP
jgi:hypothetical protein